MLRRAVLQLRDGPQRPLGDRRPADRVGHGKDMLLDLWREAPEIPIGCCGPSWTDCWDRVKPEGAAEETEP